MVLILSMILSHAKAHSKEWVFAWLREGFERDCMSAIPAPCPRKAKGLWSRCTASRRIPHPQPGKTYLNHSSPAIERVGSFEPTCYRCTAPDVSDPFVGVDFFDLPDVGHPFTIVRTGGVSRFNNFEAYGRDSTQSVGNRAEVKLQIGLLPKSRRVHVARTVAALVFELSEEQ